MKKLFVIFALVFCPYTVVFAEDIQKINSNKSNLILSIRRIGLDFSKTKVNNSEYYLDSPVSSLSATSQEYIKGVFDTVLEYVKEKFNWDNGLFMEYSKTTLKPYNAPPVKDENLDKILLYSNFSYNCWSFFGLKLGPTFREAYETQFTNSDENPRQNVNRFSMGFSLFDHDIIKSLYLVGIYEYDFTYAHKQNSKLGLGVGGRLEYELRKGVRFSLDSYYRQYFVYSEYISTDLERDFNFIIRMDTNLWGGFTMGPYAQYRLAKSKGASVYGSNLIFGISFNYITKFLLN